MASTYLFLCTVSHVTWLEAVMGRLFGDVGQRENWNLSVQGKGDKGKKMWNQREKNEGHGKGTKVNK